MKLKSGTYEELLPNRSMTARQRRVLGLLYMAWRYNRLSLYPLLCLPSVIPFHQSYKAMVALFGGNRSSKTMSGAAEWAMIATGQHYFKHSSVMPKPPFQLWVMTEDFKTAWDVQLQALLYWLPPSSVGDIRWSGSVHEMDIIRPDGNVLIQFRSWTQGFRRHRGRFVVGIWFDEEPEDEDVFREAEFRTLGQETGRIMITCTPQSGTLSYLYDRIIVNDKKDKEVEFWMLNTYDNFYLDKEHLKRMDEIAIGDDEAERDMRIKGLFAIKTGRVYKQYVDEKYDEEKCPKGCLYSDVFIIPKWWERWIAVDPGYDVCAVGWYAVDPATRWCYKYREARFENEPMSVITKDIKHITGDEYIVCCVCDGSDPGAAKEIEYLLKIRTQGDREFAANLEDIPEKSRKRAGIERVRYYLTGATGPRLLVNETCLWTRKEFIRHALDDRGEPEKRNDHHVDETRYFISSRPKPRMPSIYATGDAPSYDEIIKMLESKKSESPFRIIGGS